MLRSRGFLEGRDVEICDLTTTQAARVDDEVTEGCIQ